MKVIHSFGTAYIAQQLRLDSCEFASPDAGFDAGDSETDVPTDHPSTNEATPYGES
ncbi:MAG: hypothetical protein HC799_16265 [Limnothrix sp. RL_2_0]|nr:hypothetical protein [Limnothrix sp. RL_2_0]